MIIDLVAQFLQEARLLIGSPHLADILQCLLNAVRDLDPGRLGDLGVAFGKLAAAEEQREGYRHAPEAGQSELPVIRKEHHGNDGRGEIGAVEIAQAVRPDMLQAVHVAHDGLGQIREITLAEIAQRQLAQALGQADADIFHLAVHKAVGGFILLQMCEEGEHHKGQHQKQDRQRPGERRAGSQRIHIAGHHQKQDPHAAHDHQVYDHGPERALLDVLYPLLREGVFALKVFSEHITSPPPQKSSIARPGCNPPTSGRRGRLP